MRAPSWFDWKASRLEPAGGRPLSRSVDHLGERRGAVDLRLAQAEPAQVGAIQQQDAHQSSPRPKGVMRSRARSSSDSVTSSTSMTRADGHGQDPALPAAHPLLVRTERVPHGRTVERAVEAVAQAPEQVIDAFAETSLRATALRDGGHGAQTQHDRLAVGQVVVALDLQRVAQGVAQVERPPLARLERVAIHDAQLETHRAFHHRVAGRLVVRRAPPRRVSRAATRATDRR